MKIRSSLLWGSVFILCFALISVFIGQLFKKHGGFPFQKAWVQWQCHQALQTYLEQERAHGSTFSNDWLSAQFYRNEQKAPYPKGTRSFRAVRSARTAAPSFGFNGVFVIVRCIAE